VGRRSRPAVHAPGTKRPLRRSLDIEARARSAPERLPRPRLLACDIDGTLLDDHGILPRAVGDAVAAIIESGVEVVLATGRSPWSGIAQLSDRLGLAGPQITMQGALVSVPATGDIHRLRDIPTALYRDAIRFADELGLDPVVGLLDGHRAERLPDGLELFATPLADSLRFQYIEGLERLGRERPVRVFLPTGPERHAAVRRRALAHFTDRASIVWSDMTGIEILAPGTNKGDAVTWLAASRGIAPGEVAAVGDAANDMEMLRWAGRSAAMGTAPGDVRRCADVVVPSSAELGVLDAFAWFFPDLASEIGARSLSPRPASRAG
jgi:5-amino-6-(5-phospho-D-ribitylamino)uracil phosphatase